MRSHGTCRPNRASKSRSHYIALGWGPIGALMICLNAAVGICVEWHSDDGTNGSERLRTGSNLVHVHMACRSTVVASPVSTTGISLQRLGSAKLRLSTAGKRRHPPCPDANRYGATLAEAQGGPQSEVGAWGREPIWGEAKCTSVRRSPP